MCRKFWEFFFSLHKNFCVLLYSHEKCQNWISHFYYTVIKIRNNVGGAFHKTILFCSNIKSSVFFITASLFLSSFYKCSQIIERNSFEIQLWKSKKHQTTRIKKYKQIYSNWLSNYRSLSKTSKRNLMKANFFINQSRLQREKKVLKQIYAFKREKKIQAQNHIYKIFDRMKRKKGWKVICVCVCVFMFFEVNTSKQRATIFFFGAV